MIQFHNTLNRLETRLQAMVEGSVSLLFPPGTRPKDLAQLLIASMRAEIRPSPEGKLLAPNLFTVFLPAEDALFFQSQPELLEELAQKLYQACQETQVQLVNKPVIKVLPNPESPSDDFRVLAQYSLLGNERTSILQPPPAQGDESHSVRAYLIVDGTQIFTITESVVNIGRHEDNQLVIPDAHVSRSHAQLRVIRGRYIIFDLGSTGGTYINGRKITQSTLAPGDVISLGGIPVVFGMENQPDIEQTQEIPQDTL